MKKIKIGKWLFLLIILFLMYEILGCALPVMKHKTPTNNQLMDWQNRMNTVSNERVKCLDNNAEALLWRLKIIEEATEEIVFSSFDFRDDTTGKIIMSCLSNAANRGIEIKILIDGMNGFLKLRDSNYFKSLISLPTVQAKYYNPLNLFTPWNLNYRMHDKYIIIDNNLYLLGGRNTNDLFLTNNSQANIDRDILVYTKENHEENSINYLRKYFNNIWELNSNEKLNFGQEDYSKYLQELRQLYAELPRIYPQAFESTDWLNETLETKGVSIICNPIGVENKTPELWSSLNSLMTQGEKIVIQTPYIICGNEMYQDITNLAEDGKEIKIITNSPLGGSNIFGCADYLNQKDKINSLGADVYEYLGDNSLHTKSVLIDDHICVVGSFNFDMRSTYLDTELMLVIDCEPLNREIQTTINEYLNYSHNERQDGYLYRSVELPLNKKVIYSLLRVLCIPFRNLL